MTPVKWRGLSAVYSPGEREIMMRLPVQEQAILHYLKSETSGEIQNPLEIQGVKPRASAGSLAPSGQHDDRVPRPGTPGGLTIYTDPEDLEFGAPPKRTKKIYALVWTWQSYRVEKTKKRCEERLKTWKRWYERQGWRVYRVGNGYWADRDGERHAASLHEYDRETLERLC